ncbi:hypothetical protein P4V43_26865 [Brevibacillus fortis]|uniref:hypothetical protein n=1 Tax=Brevibacillus fortis TaxID=2126352 RepID=UPI002E1E682A|nr:hypothetical protein [Brevibacillus fortis]
MESYVNSLNAYGVISAFEEMHKCLNEMLTYFDENSLPMDLPYIKKLKGVYNTTVGNFGKKEGSQNEKGNGCNGAIIVNGCVCQLATYRRDEH